MDKIKKLILFRIPMSICNFRCHYCYLAQREESFQGIQPEMKYTPEQVRYALRKERIGGCAYLNFCADGETLLVKDIDQYIKMLIEEGHYAEIVTNMTINSTLDKILSWDRSVLSHVSFKASFHYLELKKKKLLDRFVENVKRAWEAGASVNIEVTPSDELIPYLDELKDYSMKNFGALPHLTIARDDRTSSIDYLTHLPMEQYDRIWSQFDSDFWKFKKGIFGVHQSGYCHAGLWSIYIDLTTGEATPCYCGHKLHNVFKNPEKPIDCRPIGNCPIAHCYNGHMLLTLGVIPGATNVRYGDIRDRNCVDGSHWLQPELKDFFNTKLEQSNDQVSFEKKIVFTLENTMFSVCNIPSRGLAKLKRITRRIYKKK